MSDVSKVKISGTTYDIKDATARAELLTKLSDAPSNGEEYVRKNGQWAISSGGSGGGGGGVNAMYYYQQTVNTATNAEIMRITDPRINSDSIVLECTFADPSYITSDVTWTSYAGYMAFTGTCKTATTANVTIGYTSNDNFSDRLMTLVWENSSPTSSFAGQTLSNLDLSNYDFLLVKVNGKPNQSAYVNQVEYCIVEKNVTKTMQTVLGAIASTENTNKYVESRDITFNDTSITFSNGYGRQWNVTTASAGTLDNNACVPLKIYGISRYNYFEDHSSTMDLLYSGNPNANTDTSLISGKKFSDYTTLVVIVGNLSNNFNMIIPMTDFYRAANVTNNWWWIDNNSNAIWETNITYVSDTSFKLGSKGSYISSVKIYGIGRYSEFVNNLKIRRISVSGNTGDIAADSFRDIDTGYSPLSASSVFIGTYGGSPFFMIGNIWVDSSTNHVMCSIVNTAPTVKSFVSGHSIIIQEFYN